MELPPSFKDGSPREPGQFEELEKLDDQLIVQGLEGVVSVQDLFYVISQGDYQIVGISTDGVREIARQYAEKKGYIFRIKELTTSEDEEYYYVRCKVEVDYPSGGHMEGWGSKRQQKHEFRKDGSNPIDRYAFEKAISKAQRNALLSVIPKTFIEMAYKEWRENRTPESRVVSKKATPAEEPKVVPRKAVSQEASQRAKDQPAEVLQEKEEQLPQAKEGQGVLPKQKERESKPKSNGDQHWIQEKLASIKEALAKENIPEQSLTLLLRRTFNTVSMSAVKNKNEFATFVKALNPQVVKDLWNNNPVFKRWEMVNNLETLTEEGWEHYASEINDENVSDLTKAWERNNKFEEFKEFLSRRVPLQKAQAYHATIKSDDMSVVAVATLLTSPDVWKLEKVQKSLDL
ncbi:MAG: hypothetical protein QXO25_04430 [Candidatus Bathyarchaeia archaeon]